MRSPGFCLPVPAGMDPGNDCDATPASTCGTEGSCDGAGGCRLHAAGVQCAAATCSGMG